MIEGVVQIIVDVLINQAERRRLSRGLKRKDSRIIDDLHPSIID